MKVLKLRSPGWLLLALFLLQPAVPFRSRAATNDLHPLWKVQGASNVVYLLGSVHLLKESDYPLAAPIESAFSNAQVAVFETDIGELQSMGVQLKMLSKATLPEGETLKDQLSAGTYASLSKHAEDAGLPLAMFAQMKPVMVVVMLEVMELQKLGLNPELGLDQHFFNKARDRGNQIVPLETVDFQIGLVTDFSREEEELLVKSTLEEIDDTKKLFDEMHTAWKTGNGPQLEKLLNDAMRDSPGIFKRLVTDRSRSWVPKIEELLRGSKNAIVIVGAGHLVGAEGVVELLKKNGWKVTQL